MSKFAPKTNILLTGDRPTGKLHLGHYVGSLKNRVALQNDEAISKRFYMVADLQGLTDNFLNPQKIEDNVNEVILDNLAVGLDPSKTTIFIQSTIPFISELTMLFMNLVTVSRLERNPTVKDDIKEKGFGRAIPAGFLAFPVSQAADILCVKADIIPVGNDQVPHIEQTNEVGGSFNRHYGNIFPYVKALIGEEGRLVGTDGNAKASKSLGNAIYLSDDAKEIQRKVMSMYTDPGHIRVDDPGKIEGNVVFSYLDIFDSNKEEVQELKDNYRQGGLGDVKLKKRLIEVLMNKLAPIQKKRNEYAQDPAYIKQILREGFETTMTTTEKVRNEVREAVKLYTPQFV